MTLSKSSDFVYQLVKGDNNGASLVDELKEGFLKVFNTLSNKQVFNKEIIKKLARIDSTLSWHESSSTNVTTRINIFTTTRLFGN